MKRPSEIEAFARDILSVELTPNQLEMLKNHAEAMAKGKELVIVRMGRRGGMASLRNVVGNYLLKSLEPKTEEHSPSEAIDKVFEILAALVHKDYGAGPDGFKIFKEDVGKYMAEAKKLALTSPRPALKYSVPKNFPKF
jgi:hypothetical protein